MRNDRLTASVILLALLLTACGRSTTSINQTLATLAMVTNVSPSSTSITTPTTTLDPVQIDLATRFAAFDLTATIRALTPSPTATVTHTAAPTPTQTPTSTITVTPSPSARPGFLFEAGPWLVLEQELLSPPESWFPSRRYFLANSDGTNLQPVALPDPDIGFTWQIVTVTRGQVLAFIEVSQTSPFYLQNGLQSNSLKLFLLKLPENRVMRVISLLDQPGLDLVEKERAGLDPGFEVPLTLCLVSDPSSPIWSPDGRYLAFTSAANGSAADVYIYDTVNDRIRQITSLHGEGAQAWFWSSDSNWLTYRTGNNVSVDQSPIFASISGVWASSMEIDNRPRFLYDPISTEWLVKRTKQGFYVQDSYFESDPENLRYVTFETGRIELLYKESFTSSDIDDQLNILIVFSPEISWSKFYNYPFGIYQLLPGSNSLKPLLPGSYTWVWWEKDRQVFRIGIDHKPKYYRFSSTGKFSPIAEESVGISSPDGKFRVTRILPPEWESENDIVKVFTATGQEVADQGSGWRTNIRWAPDSTGFYYFNCEDGCRFYNNLLIKGWHSEEIAGELVTPETDLSNYWLVEPH